MTNERPRTFLLFHAGGSLKVTTTGGITAAIRKAETEMGVRPNGGRSLDDGTRRFDPDAELEEWMAARRGRVTT